MTPPGFALYSHQTTLTLPLDFFTELAGRAWQHVIGQPGPEEPALPDLEEVEISFLTDEAIAMVHAEFLKDPTPTDVITFAHGEILISTDTALRQAAENNLSPEREVALYVIHGLLHLNGHEDHTELGFNTMRRIQEEILAAVYPLP